MATDARVRITAQNNTGPAFRSVLADANKMGTQLRGIFRAAGGYLIGRELVRGFREVVKVTAGGNAEFAASLNDVKASMAGLFDGSSGVPAATASLRELQNVLNDPTARAAAQQLAGSILEIGAAGASVAAQFAGGLGLIFNGPSQLSMQIDAKIEEMQELERQVREQIDNMNPSATAQREAMERGLQDLIKRRTELERQYWDAIDKEGKALREKQRQAAGAQQSEDAALRRKLIEQHSQQVAADQRLTQTGVEAQVASWEAFYAALERLRKGNAISDEQYLTRYKEQLDEVLSEVQVTAMPIERRTKDEDPFADFKSESEDFGQVFDPLIAAGDRAAANLQGVFENFFFDPMDDGFKGMLRGFVSTLRQMVAEAAAAQLMKALGFGGSGGGIFGDILGAVVSGFGGGSWSGSWSDGYVSAGGNLGFASGGSFKVGGHGGTDSKMVAFRATPGELVDIRRPGQAEGSGAITVSPVYNIDARGATQDLVRALPEILARNNDALKSDIISGIKRGKYAV